MIMQVPPTPLFVARTADTIVMKTHPAYTRARPEVKTITLFGKAFGAGTCVSTFNTEFPGTGVPHPLENGKLIITDFFF